jgi:hypothetical protein
MRIDKASRSGNYLDTVSVVESFPHRHLLANDARRTSSQIRKRWSLVRAREQRITPCLRDLENSMTQCLAGDRTVVRAATADFVSLDGTDAFAPLDGLHGRAFACRAGANDENVEVVLRC